MEPRGNSKTAVEARRNVWIWRLRTELTRMTGILCGHPSVRRVILFGSLAAGEAGSRSDLDLVIVQNTDKRFMDRLDEFYRLLTPKVETDILVYTPREWETLSTTRQFVKKIASQGVTLYEAIDA